MVALQYFGFEKDNNISHQEEVDIIDSWTRAFISRFSPTKATMLTAAALLEFGVSKCLVSVPSPGNHVWRRVGCAPNYSHFRSYDSSQRQVNTQAFKDSIRQPIMVVHVSRRQASFFRYRRHQANQSATFWNRMNIQGTSSELFSDNLAFERYMGFKNRDPTSKFDRIPGIANHSLACFSFRNLKLIRWNGWIPNVFWLTRRRAAVLGTHLQLHAHHQVHGMNSAPPYIRTTHSTRHRL